jgi:hypothetical protein
MSFIRFFFILFLVSFESQAYQNWIDKAHQLRLSDDKQWKDLLHYRLNAIGQYRSQVKGKEFFLSEKGFKDYSAELDKTIEGLLNQEPVSEEHPICRFPARKKWLQSKLSIPEDLFLKIDCKLYGFYKERMRSNSISVVFSSYYADSPSSSFGHTLFKVNKKRGESNELLDWGIGYAGEVNTGNSLVYIYKGLTGGFRGTFSSVPYYMKVREYNDYESRDIWSYELDLTANELDFLLDHLWEVGDSHFDYYFLTQNCGFHMLTVLEAAAPRLNLVDRVPFWVIPADALKAMTETPGLIKSVGFRPSLFAQLEANYGRFTPSERDFLEAHPSYSQFELTKVNLAPESQAKILDQYLHNFDFSFAKEIAKEKPEVLRERNKILVARSKRPTLDQIQILPEIKHRPDLSHPSARFNLLAHQINNDGQKDQILTFDMRFALHDSLDPIRGYPEFSTIEMFRFVGHYFSDEQKWDYKRFQFLNIEALTPVTDVRKQSSWGATVEWDRRRDPVCYNCGVFSLRYGVGYTFFGLNENQAFAFMGYLRPMYSEDLPERNELVLEPKLTWLQQGDLYSWRLSFGGFYRSLRQQKLWSTFEVETRYQFSNQTFLNLTGQKIGEIEDFSLGYGIFF